MYVIKLDPFSQTSSYIKHSKGLEVIVRDLFNCLSPTANRITESYKRAASDRRFLAINDSGKTLPKREYIFYQKHMSEY